MISLIKAYQQHKSEIERFIIDNVNHNDIIELDHKSLERFFQTFKSLKQLYVTNENYHQNSPSFSRDSKDTSSIGTNRTALFKTKKFNENGEYISSPYISSLTGKTIITFIKKVGNSYLVMDFGLIDLLEELGYVTHALFFTRSNKLIYGLIGYGLTLLSIILILYSFISFLFSDSSLIETTFKSIISLTLGLAVFDLGKNLLEHEVVYKDNNPHEKSDSKMFIKFLISIITALSIEALMLVLKISLTKNYDDILNAVYLISGVSLMIATLALFYKFTTNNH